MVNKQEAVNILTNFSKFKESWEELIRGTAKLEQMNWSSIFWNASIAAMVKNHPQILQIIYLKFGMLYKDDSVTLDFLVGSL